MYIHFYHDGYSGTHCFMIYKGTEEDFKRGERRMVAKPVELEFEEEIPGMVRNPTFRLPEYQAEGLLKSMAEAMDRQGVRTEKDDVLKGLVEAQTAHLEDMRNIAKKAKIL